MTDTPANASAQVQAQVNRLIEVIWGDPLTDLGYFMGAGIGTDLRRPNEAHLLELYRTELADTKEIELAQQLEAGMYFLRVETENGPARILRFVVEQ